MFYGYFSANDYYRDRRDERILQKIQAAGIPAEELMYIYSAKDDSVKGYSWIDFYLNDSPVPLFCTKTYQDDWRAFSEGILDEMQKVAMKWKTMNS